MASIKSVLTNYFKQLHFNSMSPAVRARWEEYLNLNDLNSSMKDWRKQLMEKEKDEHGKDLKNKYGNDVYKNKELPDIATELSNDQLIELYKGMNNAISGMAEDKKIEYDEFSTAKTFVKDFYGENNVFHIIKVSDQTKRKLENLVKGDLLDKLKQPIEDAIRYIGGDKKPSFKDIVDGIKSGKYDKDSTFRSQLIGIFERIESGATWAWMQNPVNASALREFTNVRDSIIQGLDPEPTSADVERFKRNLEREDEGNVLVRLYKKSKAKELFVKHDDDRILDALDTARDEVNYDKKDSDNFLEPKTEEKQLNFPQTVKDKWEKFRENRLDKWHNLGGDRMFRSRAAEDVVKALKKEGIKPTDGLEAILTPGNVDKLKTTMGHTSVQTGKHFKWFIDELNDIKNDKNHKDAFGACLFNGVSLRAVVDRICRDGAKSGKIAEAKSALEILSVIKYENTTSKTLDALKKYYKDNPEGILNNKDLSWNKNPAAQFVTNALTKTIRIGGIAIATMATVAVNTIRKMGSKIKKESKDLAAAHNEWRSETASQRAALDSSIENSKNIMNESTQKRDAIIAEHGSEKDIDKEMSDREKDRDEILTSKILVENLKQIKNFVDMEMGTEEEINAANMFLANYQEYIDGKTPSLDVPKELPSEIKKMAQDVRQHLWGHSFKSADTKWRNAKQVKTDFVNATNQLTAATHELEASEKERKDWDENHMDRYDELIKYWNELEFGRDMHLGRIFGGSYSRWGSKKKQQAKFYGQTDDEGNLIYNNGYPRKDPYQRAA